ncbi:MAG: flagellar hook-associated protein FlgL [Lachnospiraceae bacterium]|nr:flagellar hook-associated protein FlgL [Lachnospiraceae bacterium]
MRITNKMMTNNVLHNINNNKNLLSTLENQYSTGKKIQKPSDDPIIAVRALKLRTNLSEITQYTEKNIPDALSWMDTTESSLDVVNDILRQMNTYCNQGANDTLTAEDRNSIVENLEQLKQHIYQEGNSNYAGRYVFSGYKTDTPLVFNEPTDEYTYRITEPLCGDDISAEFKIVNNVDINAFDKNNPDAFDKTMPNQIQYYRMRLGYANLEPGATLTYTDGSTDAEGYYNKIDIPITEKGMNDADAYQPGEDEVYFIRETGELIYGKNAYEKVRKSEHIDVTYSKKEFQINDLRPEHYFNCTRTNADGSEVLNFEKMDLNYNEEEKFGAKKGQEIQYEVNFNQKLTINTQGDEAFTHDIGRAIDDIINAVSDVKETEEKMAEVDKMLEDTNLTPEQRKALEGIKEQLTSEFTLRTDIMQAAFAGGLSDTIDMQDKVNVAVSDLGGRYNRLLLTQGRLGDQQVDFEDLLSSNEDVDLVDTIIKYTSAETIYNSSLSAASKLVQTSLLDFL